MSDKFNPYGDTEQVRWSRIHSKECSGAFDYFYGLVEGETQKHLERTLNIPIEELTKNIGESLGADAQGIMELSRLLDTPEKKNKFLQEAITAINHSYALFGTIASGMDDSSKVGEEYIIYDFQSEEIPPAILKSLQFRVFDHVFRFLGTTRSEHYKSIMESVREGGKTLKLWQYETTLVVVDNKIVLQSAMHPGKTLGVQSIFGKKTEGILARKPYERAVPFNIFGDTPKEPVRSKAKIVRHKVIVPPSTYDEK